MIRKIVDYQKLNEDILNLLLEKYPDGYGDNDVITFKNAKGEVVEAIEVKTEDTIYLVKVGLKLIKAMEDFADDYDQDNDDNDSETEMADMEFLADED
ncbi:hypothetical protein FUA26_12560 [Seonamhaeicola algicola]|uniref:DNA primase n=1 Tax=Seonamhaeicola algicola TaxID=1719036 RepID=A0A5C7ADX2_9FLAO|nr:hypothetical protein [Seonamhaeicola algicola]TXE07050.1 hypothetical protein FUA26_12560 [Seonamhaeicola algicola]